MTGQHAGPRRERVRTYTVWDGRETLEQPPAPVSAERQIREHAAATAYEPHGIDTPETLAAIVARARAQAAQEPPQEPTQEPLPPPPPMPYPGDLSRIMVSQIPSPPPNDRNAGWTHQYAEYMRRIGVATNTHTNLEHTMAWGVPALGPGDGTGVRL